MFSATDHDYDLVHVPLVAGSGAVPTDALREGLTKAVDPQSDGLAADNDTLLRQQIFNIRRANGEAMVNPDRAGDDFTRITQALQAWQIRWSIHALPVQMIATSNNLAIPSNLS